MTKITKSTIKSFIRKNRDALLIMTRGTFDGMFDGIDYSGQRVFKPATPADGFDENTLGINGVWLVSGSRNCFTKYETDTHVGIECDNCCGSFIVAVAK